MSPALSAADDVAYAHDVTQCCPPAAWWSACPPATDSPTPAEPTHLLLANGRQPMLSSVDTALADGGGRRSSGQRYGGPSEPAVAANGHPPSAAVGRTRQGALYFWLLSPNST